MNEEKTVEGAILVGAAVFDSTERVCAAISISTPTARWSIEKRRKTTAAVTRSAAAITGDLVRLGFEAINNTQPSF